MSEIKNINVHDKTKTNELVYVMDDETTGESTYAMYMNGEPVFYAYANKNVFDMPITVSIPEFDAPRSVLPNCRAFLIDDMSRINGNSMKAVIYPNLAWIIASLYVPQGN